MPMRCDISENGATIRILPPDRFDFSCHLEFRDAFSKHDGKLKYIVDLRGTNYIDSSALGMLLLLRQHAGDGRRVSIINAKPDVLNILEVVNFGDLFILE